MQISRKYFHREEDRDSKPKRLKKAIPSDKVRTKKSVPKKNKEKTYKSPLFLCPFCGEELSVDKSKIDQDKEKGLWAVDWLAYYRVSYCEKCGAGKVAECPACKHSTWYQPSSKTFKHQCRGCGFFGQKTGEQK